MAFSGYIGKKPDAAWWLSQIQAGEAYRRKWAHEAKWDTWRSYYRGNWAAGVLPKNIFFSMLRTVVPRTYFRNPSVSVSPDKPGIENQAFARILERIDNKMLREMGFKREVKRAVQSAFLFGTSFFKVGFGGVYSPSNTQIDEMARLAKRDDNSFVEYRQDIDDNKPWVMNAGPGEIILPDGVDHYENARWIAHKIVRPIEDVQADRRLTNTKGLVAVSDRLRTPVGNIEHSIPEIDLYEIRDSKTRRVFVIAKSTINARDSKVIYDSFDDMQSNGGFSIIPLQFNPDDQVFWAVPDSQILEPYQLELNEIRTQQMKHRRLSLVKILVKRLAMTPEEAEKLVSEDVCPVVFTEGDPASTVKIIQAATIPPELSRAEMEIMQDVRETVGFSRNALGEAQPASARTSATESNIVRESSEIRVDERRDEIADILGTVIEKVHLAMFRFWRPQDVVDVIGPGGMQVWVTMSPELLSRGKYNIKVDPDTSTPLTRAAREKRAVELYSILKTNPQIDAELLTRFLLHELHGTQFDEMMKSLPVPQQGIPSGAVSPNEFTSLLKNSIGQVANGNGGAKVAQALLPRPGAA